MAVRAPLYLNSGNLQEMTTVMVDNLIDQIDDNDDAEHIDTSDEGMTTFDNLDDAKIKFKELLNSTKGINQEK